MLINNKYQQLNWTKNNGLMPAIIQHYISGEVLMLGYMNKAAIITTTQTGYVTFFSRKKQRLWTKGETSGNTLKLINCYPDCDNDSLLILVMPTGPTCHKNTNSCFYPATVPTTFNFLHQLENIICKNKNISPSHTSYTARLYASGIKRIAQKVGEEGLETALAAISGNTNEIINEASDLIYHLLVLLQHQSLTFTQVLQTLQKRQKISITKND